MIRNKMAGKRSLLFARPPVILGAGCVAGEKGVDIYIAE